MEVELLVMEEEEAVELPTMEEMVKVQRAKEVAEVVVVLQIKKMEWKDDEDKELKVELAHVGYCTKGEKELVVEHFLKEARTEEVEEVEAELTSEDFLKQVGVEVEVEVEVELGSDHFLVEVEVGEVEPEMTSKNFLKQVGLEVEVQIEVDLVETKVEGMHFVKELRVVEVNHSAKVVKMVKEEKFA